MVWTALHNKIMINTVLKLPDKTNEILNLIDSSSIGLCEEAYWVNTLYFFYSTMFNTV